MGRLVEQFSNHFYITPDNPRYEKQDDIVNDIVKGLSTDHYDVINDRGEALKQALVSLNSNDVLVVLGKGRENYQEIDGVRQTYSDIDIIEEFCANSATRS